jgi:hypothetical protein
MRRRVHEFSSFVAHFVRYLLHVQEVIVSLVLLLALGGVVISQIEGLDLGRGLYFAFITGLSIGYGDITPESAGGRFVSVVLGMIGMVFIGITVAVATRAFADTLKEHDKREQ